MANEKKDIWDLICERAGYELEEDEQGNPIPRPPGPPTHIPMTIVFAWHPTKDDPNNINPQCSLPHATRPTIFKVGKPVPSALSAVSFLVLAIFEDDFTIRVYALPEIKSEKEADNIPLRWTLTRTTTTMSCAHFPDPKTFVEAVAAELLLAEEELSDLPPDGDEEPEDLPPPAQDANPPVA